MFSLESRGSTAGEPHFCRLCRTDNMGLQWSRVSAGRPNKSAPDSWQDCRRCPVLLARWQIGYDSGMRNAIIPQTLYHTSSCTVMLFKKYMSFHDALYILSAAYLLVYIRQLNPCSKWFWKPWIVSVWSSIVRLPASNPLRKKFFERNFKSWNFDPSFFQYFRG